MSLARKFVDEKFVGTRGVMGVLLTGSSAIGIKDEFVDLDFEVIVTEKHYGQGEWLADETKYGGFEVCWGWTTLEKLESKLIGWRNDINLWVYSTSKIMYDPTGKVKSTLEKYKKYPEDVRKEKMFSYFFYGWAEAPYNFEKALQRNDPLTAQLCLNNAIEIFTALLFIVNNSFVPYRKWRLHELTKLVNKPSKYEERIKQLIRTDNFSRGTFNLKHKIIHHVVNELKKMLIQEGVPAEKIGNDMWRHEPKYEPSL